MINYFPRISIVTPSLNQGKFIEKTILSIISQNYPNLEFIIIDGGSTDETISIIKKYEKYITYWVSEPDKGQSNAINKGLQKAKGEVVNWINSDDLLEPGALFKVAEAWNKNPNAPAWVGGCRRVNEYGLEINVVFPNNLCLGNIGENWNGRQFYQPSCFLNHKLVKKVGMLNESLHFCMDLDLFIRLAQYGMFYKGDGIWAQATIHSSAKTQNQRSKMHQETAQVQKQYKFILGAKNRISSYIEKKEQELQGNFIIYDLLQKKYKFSIPEIAFSMFEKRCGVIIFVNNLSSILYFLAHIYPYLLSRRKNIPVVFLILTNNISKNIVLPNNVFLYFQKDIKFLKNFLTHFRVGIFFEEVNNNIFKLIKLSQNICLPLVCHKNCCPKSEFIDGDNIFVGDDNLELILKTIHLYEDPISWTNFVLKNKAISFKNKFYLQTTKKYNDKNKICFISDFLPFIDSSSSCLRVSHILNLISTNVELLYLYFNDSKKGDIFKSKNLNFQYVNFDINDILISIDLFKPSILWITNLWTIEWMALALDLVKTIKRYRLDLKIIFDTMDFHAKKFFRKYKITKQLKDIDLANQFLDLEKALYPLGDDIVVVSENEKHNLEKEIFELPPITVIPNIHTFPKTFLPFEQRQGLVFLGNFEVNHNYDAVLYFLENIFPFILEKDMSIKFNIIGYKSKELFGQLNLKNVVVHGYVKNLHSALQQFRVFVCPLTYGAGMKGKIGEAIVSGLPIVSTAIGIEGFDLRDKVDCFVADNPDDFALKTSLLYSKQDIWENFVKKSREKLEEKINLDKIKTNINKLLS